MQSRQRDAASPDVGEYRQRIGRARQVERDGRAEGALDEPRRAADGVAEGLGLATTLGIVEQHDGWIEVTSMVDRGSSFTVHLPFARAELASSCA